MTIGLAFLSLMMVVIVGWLWRQTLNTQPWQAQEATLQVQGGGYPRPVAKAALWVFLCVATSLFALFISAYAMRLGFADWSPLPRPRLLMVNTVALVAASLAMEGAVHAARRADRRDVLRRLAAAGLLTLGFLIGQLIVWKQLNDAAFSVSTSAAAAFFYLLTAVHGLHVLGGLVAWARAFIRVSSRVQGPGATQKIRLGVELCATYWHYLLAVWVVLYALLVSSDLGMAICTGPTP